MGELSEAQRALLAYLGDGNQHNLLAWPLFNEDESMTDHIRYTWAAAMLHVRGFVDIEEVEEDEAIWLTITPTGRAALGEADG